MGVKLFVVVSVAVVFVVYFFRRSNWLCIFLKAESYTEAKNSACWKQVFTPDTLIKCAYHVYQIVDPLSRLPDILQNLITENRPKHVNGKIRKKASIVKLHMIPLLLPLLRLREEFPFA